MIYDILVPIILLILAVGFFILSFIFKKDFINTLGRKDKYYNRFRIGIYYLGLNLNSEKILGVRLVVVIALFIYTVILSLKSNSTALIPGILAILIYFYPIKWLESKEKERLESIKREFPVMVSFLKVYTRAADLYRALKITGDAIEGELKRQFDILSTELEIYSIQEALDNLAIRCNYTPMSNLVSVIHLGIREGSDIEELLDNFAKSAYNDRVQEVKRKIKVQPIIATIMPALLLLCILVMIMYPMFADIINQIGGTGASELMMD